MGNACISALKRMRVQPPTDGTTMDSGEMRSLVQDAFRLSQSRVYVSDGSYLAYSKDKLQAFLSADLCDVIKYKADSFDCDDFARVLVGREREWFRQHNQGDKGSSLGIVWGDIRPTEESTTPYYHAMNFFVDSNGELWLVEPQSDKLSKPTSNSTFQMACV